MSEYKKLPEAIATPDSVDKLILNTESDSVIAEKLPLFKNLKALRINRNNSCTCLPEAIIQLKQLEELDLSFSEYLNIDWCLLEKLENLKILNLRGIKTVEKIPANIANIRKLETFIALSNNITEIDEAAFHLPHLQHLELSLEMELLPDSFFENMKNLKRFKTGFALNLKKFPASFYSLPAIESIVAENMYNVVFDMDKICEMKSLKEINFNQTAVSSIPKTIGQLQNLEILILGDRGELQIPDEIGELKNLKVLKIWRSKVKKIPASIQNLTELEELELYCNQIDNIPMEIGKLKNLKKLDLHENTFESIPDEIGELENLETLELAARWDNKDNGLKSLPRTIGKLSKLDVLSVSYQKLESFPDELCNLNKLRCLHFRENNIKKLPEDIGNMQTLHYISAEKNKLENLPESLWNKKSFSLKLTGNKFPQEEIDKIAEKRKGGNYSIDMPHLKKVKAKKETPKTEKAVLKDEILNELKRLNIKPVKVDAKKVYSIKRNGEKIEIPKPMEQIIKSLKSARKNFYYSYYGSSDIDDMKQIGFINPDEISEYPCLEAAPYLSIAADQHYCYYVVNAEDEQPENPKVYYVDHDDWDEADANEIFGTLSEFLSKIFTREEVNASILEMKNEGDFDGEVMEIGLLIHISNQPDDKIDGINAPCGEIESIAGIENYVNLKRLSLFKNNIENISMLSSLKRLEELNLNSNKINDISSIKDFEFLKYIHLSDNKISDINSLKNLPRLKTIDLANNAIMDISALSELSSLESINLNNNPISDITPLLSLKALRRLYISGTKVKDFAPLESLKLETLKTEKDVE